MHLNRLTDQKIIYQSNKHQARFKMRFNLCPNKGEKRIATILTWYIFLLCAGTILVALHKVSIHTLRNQLGILTLCRAILEWYRFLLCAEHKYISAFTYKQRGSRSGTAFCRAWLGSKLLQKVIAIRHSHATLF